jgi:hypothetical protein
MPSDGAVPASAGTGHGWTMGSPVSPVAALGIVGIPGPAVGSMGELPGCWPRKPSCGGQERQREEKSAPAGNNPGFGLDRSAFLGCSAQRDRWMREAPAATSSRRAGSQVPSAFAAFRLDSHRPGRARTLYPRHAYACTAETTPRPVLAPRGGRCPFFCGFYSSFRILEYNCAIPCPRPHPSARRTRPPGPGEQGRQDSRPQGGEDRSAKNNAPARKPQAMGQALERPEGHPSADVQAPWRAAPPRPMQGTAAMRFPGISPGFPVGLGQGAAPQLQAARESSPGRTRARKGRRLAGTCQRSPPRHRTR